MAPKKNSEQESLNDSSSASAEPSKARNVKSLLLAKMEIQAVIGRANLPLSELLELEKGAILDINRDMDAMVELVFNGRVIAIGKMTRIGSNGIGIKLHEIIEEIRFDEA